MLRFFALHSILHACDNCLCHNRLERTLKEASYFAKSLRNMESHIKASERTYLGASRASGLLLLAVLQLVGLPLCSQLCSLAGCCQADD